MILYIIYSKQDVIDLQLHKKLFPADSTFTYCIIPAKLGTYSKQTAKASMIEKLILTDLYYYEYIYQITADDSIFPIELYIASGYVPNMHKAIKKALNKLDKKLIKRNK